MNTPLWVPGKGRKTQLHHFIDFINQRFSLRVTDYPALHQWSIDHTSLFWESLALWGEVHFHEQPISVLSFKAPADPSHKAEGVSESHHMINASWFEGATLNLAQHLLNHPDDAIACYSVTEQEEPIAHTFGQLKREVAACCAYYESVGLKSGDRVCAVVINNYQSVVCMLACIALGGVWASSSPDYGLESLKDRFQQIEPTVLIASEHYTHRGKKYVIRNTIDALKEAIPSVSHLVSLEKETAHTSYHEIVDAHRSLEIPFKSLSFNHPVWILFSSGTTGKPKCMVHRTGGMLLQHLKEHRLHGDMRSNDCLFFYTTCSWMMWHWMVSVFLVGASIVLYEGSPLSPNPKRLLNIAEKLKVTAFGVGAKYLEHLEKLKLIPRKTHDLSQLRILFTTGSPLLPESFDYVYQSLSKTVQLCSISGGSDLVSCFALGCPILPVNRGELQCLGLGMDMAVFNDHGDPVVDEEGELVCRQAFPCMPLAFWGDNKKEAYMNAYFNRFPGVWTHGDFAKLSQRRGLVIQGRSDATLNRGGIRLGTAELYQAIANINAIFEALAIEREGKLFLFVSLKTTEHTTIRVGDQKPTRSPDDRESPLATHDKKELFSQIKAHIRQHLSPKHIPDQIIIAPDLPRTHNGKLLELVVKKIMSNQTVSNTGAIANPACLDFFIKLNRNLANR